MTMKKIITIIAVLFAAISFSYGQFIPLRNSDVRQIANGDTSRFYITPSTLSWQSTNPVILNNNFWTTGALTANGATTLTNYLEVRGETFLGDAATDTVTVTGVLNATANMKLGSGNDTIFFNNDTLTNVIPLDSATGDLANATTYMDNVYTTRLYTKGIGINNTSPQSKLDVFGTTILGNNYATFGNRTINKNYNTSYPESIDTSAFAWSTTPLGKPLFTLRSATGLRMLDLDSTGVWSYNYGSATSFKVVTNGVFYFYTNSSNEGPVIMNLGASGTTGGGMLRLCSQDGAVMGSGHRLGNVTFGGGTGATASTFTASIESFAVGTWGASADAGANLVFATTPDGSATKVDNMIINGNGQVDLTSAFLQRDSSITRAESSSLAAGGTIALTAATTGWGTITVDSAGFVLLIANVHWNNDGTTAVDDIQYSRGGWLTYSSSNTAGNTLSFYQNATVATIKNNRAIRLGYAIDLKRSR